MTYDDGKTSLPRYDRQQTYAWNYDHAPDPVGTDIPPMPTVAGRSDWSFCGIPVESPLGVPAGPLLNGHWVLYYASLGFDILTYKTVRSVAHPCYPLPNLLPVVCDQIDANQSSELSSAESMQGSWAVSYGMPSRAPADWQADIRWTRDQLPPGKILSVSVVGTIRPGWSLDQLADDYADCARWAVESGADCVETNFSCPNVSTRDGQLFQQPSDAERVASRVREAIGKTAYVIKIGRVETDEQADRLLDAIGPFADSLAMTNSVAKKVIGPNGEPYFDGQKRGICGAGIFGASLAQTVLFAELCRKRALSMRLIGVGGATRAEHVRAYLDAGAESVHLATAAMIDPRVAISIRHELSTVG